ncbi:MAG: [FeFe] hydrogenase H-cluster radical SAM maturase HydE [Clostridia bacterium]|nr:[FeFe] hydrogenase H-cluster radical SAM maturase HydE [Clostridia bacterium]
MNKNHIALIDRLAETHTLPAENYLTLIRNLSDEEDAYLANCALKTKETHYGKQIFIRGLIEISNICKNDCYYCGIRASNRNCERYRLTEEEILSCCEEGYRLGFRTFVMQGGEDRFFTDDVLCDILHHIKAAYPDCAVTLSLGERSDISYRRLKKAGADRYLLRHETANPEHYRLLHPKKMLYLNRLRCLHVLRDVGFQVGCGFMVGSPFQTEEMLAEELRFIEAFKPDMCGIGPFIPHKDTDFRDFGAGSVRMTCRLLSCIRLIHPTVLLPATTALGTLHPQGREMGILHGANVVMPNLSPASVRKKYMLYDNKRSDGDESAQAIASIRARLESIGCTVSVSRGDIAAEEQ